MDHKHEKKTKFKHRSKKSIESSAGKGVVMNSKVKPVVTESPPVQTMERPVSEFDPNRIPLSIFVNKPAGPTDWSVASNESLFSIRIGNISIKEEMTPSGEIEKSENVPELGKSGNPPAPIEVRERENTEEYVSVESRISQSEEVKKDIKDKEIANMEMENDRRKDKKPTQEPSFNFHPNTARVKQGSTSIKKKSSECCCSGCTCKFCCAVKMRCCFCKWPACNCCQNSKCENCCKFPCCKSFCQWPTCGKCFKSPNCGNFCTSKCYCKWSSSSNFSSYKFCKWPSCKNCCKWPNCSCKNCCKWPKCSCKNCCKWPSCGCKKCCNWSSCSCKNCSNWESCGCKNCGNWESFGCKNCGNWESCGCKNCCNWSSCGCKNCCDWSSCRCKNCCNWPSCGCKNCCEWPNCSCKNFCKWPSWSCKSCCNWPSCSCKNCCQLPNCSWPKGCCKLPSCNYFSSCKWENIFCCFSKTQRNPNRRPLRGNRRTCGWFSSILCCSNCR